MADCRLSRGKRRGRLTERDLEQLERFADYVRRVGRATEAGVPLGEAARAIYHDVYEDGGDSA